MNLIKHLEAMGSSGRRRFSIAEGGELAAVSGWFSATFRRNCIDKCPIDLVAF
jgi:hypothetical protein